MTEHEYRRAWGTPMWQASLARSRWEGPLPTMTHTRDGEHVALWWGPVVEVHPGDTVVLLPMPGGAVIEWVLPMEQEL